jgi:hypothetical protein
MLLLAASDMSSRLAWMQEPTASLAVLAVLLVRVECSG